MTNVDKREAVLTALLPEGGTYLATGDITKPPARFTSVRSLSEYAENWSGSRADSYFKYASYTPNPPDASARNVSGLKTLVFDLDVDPSGIKNKKPCYVTKGDGHNALMDLCVSQNVPTPSMVIDSGGGMHYYWVLNRVVDQQTWLDLAFSLRALIEYDAALANDTTRVCDPAGYLRIPYTFNSRSGTQCQPVQFSDALTPWAADIVDVDAMQAALPDATSRRASGPQGANAWSAGFDPFKLGKLLDPDYGSQAPMTDMIDHCALLQDAITNPPASVNNGQFVALMNTLCAATDLEEARIVAHETLKVDTRYDPVEIDRFIDRRSGLGSRGGFPRCAQLRSAYSDKADKCAACPVFQDVDEGRQYIHHVGDLTRSRAYRLAQEAPEPVEVPKTDNAFTTNYATSALQAFSTSSNEFPEYVEVPGFKLPHGLAMQPNIPGFCYTNKLALVRRTVIEDEDGKKGMATIPVADTFVWVACKVQAMRRAGSETTLRLYAAKGSERSFRIKSEDIDVGDLVKPDVLAQRLAAMSVVLADVRARGHVAQHLMECFKGAHQVSASDALGWAEDRQHIDVAGLRLYQGGNISRVEPSSKAADTVAAAQLRGDMAENLELLKMYSDNGSNAARFVLASGLGSVFMQFADQPSALVHIFGRNGTGKSALLHAMMSFLGFDAPGNIASGSTHNAIPTALGTMNGIAAAIDELSTFADDELGTLAMQVAGGEEKMRKRASQAGLHEQRAKWRTLLFGASNKAAAARIAGKGEVQTAQRSRIMDIEIGRSTMEADAETYAYAKRITKRSTGHVGVVFNGFVVQNQQEVVELHDAMALQLDQRFPRGEQRFARAAAGCACVAAEVMHSLFPNHWSISGASMLATSDRLIRAHTTRVDARQTSVLEEVSNFIHAHSAAGHTVAMDQIGGVSNPFSLGRSQDPVPHAHILKHAGATAAAYRINIPFDTNKPDAILQLIIPGYLLEHHASKNETDYSSLELQMRAQDGYQNDWLDINAGLSSAGRNAIYTSTGSVTTVRCHIMSWTYRDAPGFLIQRVSDAKDDPESNVIPMRSS